MKSIIIILIFLRDYCFFFLAWRGRGIVLPACGEGEGYLAVAEEQLVIQVGQPHVKQAHTPPHLGQGAGHLK